MINEPNTPGHQPGCRWHYCRNHQKGERDLYIAKIHQLESKVLELTDALEETAEVLDLIRAMNSAPAGDNNPTGDNCSLPGFNELLRARKALYTTPDTAIRERIKAEGFNDGVDAYAKKMESFGYLNADKVAESIKKEGK